MTEPSDLGEPGVYVSPRAWLHSRGSWEPEWWQRLGVPHLGGDEWGRRVVTVGFGWLGYVSWAFRSCWCQECHEMREQTYRLLAEDWAETRLATLAGRKSA